MKKSLGILAMLVICMPTKGAAYQAETYPHEPDTLPQIDFAAIKGTIPQNWTITIEDCDPKMHYGSVVVYIDGKIDGIGGKLKHRSRWGYLTDVHLKKIYLDPSHPHKLTIRDGIGKKNIYFLKPPK